MTQAQLNEEKRKEAAYNQLFDKVIVKFKPFGTWYQYMIGASELLTKNLPKRICIDKDGRPVVIYKGDLAKMAGVWATPTHKVISKDIAEHKYWRALGDLLGVGQIVETVKQYTNHNQCFDISPDEVREMYTKHLSKDPTNKALIQSAKKSKKPVTPDTWLMKILHTIFGNK